ncbi:YbaB/EbfC family nucleoid-associated protein [Amycolatopsis benzoatilytica]|uniref:YbaB/EbfC family nucleoid-associated protein n=1 Tax=Amycolatopsis benzoatilytica TaxID=346045 RepID=UPI00036C830A|nr:YbaB/EbfC family nucleoid-associated protein [Amycolatopsis benzoatilytica]
MQPNFDAGEDFTLLLEREARKLQEKAAALTAAFSASGASAQSPDGSVTVKIEANGSLSGIEFGSRACALGPAKLSSLVMETVRAAQRKAAERVTESYVEINGNDDAAEFIRSFLPEPEEPEESAPDNPQQDKWAPEAHDEEPRPGRQTPPPAGYPGQPGGRSPQPGYAPPPPGFAPPPGYAPPRSGPPTPPMSPPAPPSPPNPRPRRGNPADEDDEMSPW